MNLALHVPASQLAVANVLAIINSTPVYHMGKAHKNCIIG